MKYHIRKVKTTSDGIAVQVVKYENRKRVVVKHMGTAYNQDEVIILWYNAAKWIAKQTKQIHLFPQKEDFISLEQLEYLGFHWNGKSNVALIWTSQDKCTKPEGLTLL